MGLGTLCLALIGGAVWLLTFFPYARTNDALLDGYKVAVSPDLVTARIIKLHVDEGDVVKKGDLLVELDDTILQSQKVEAEAKIVALQATVMLEKYHFEKVRNDFERAKKGFDEGVTTAQQLDHAQKNYAMAKSKLEFSEADLELSVRELGVIVTKLEHTKIWASINGVIVKRWMWEGDVPSPGQAIFSLYDLDSTWVLANLEETKMQHVKLGDTVEIHIDAYPRRVFFGKIFVIKGAAASEFSLIPQDNATGNYTKVAQRIPLKISIDRSPDTPYLFPGLSAEVKIRVR
jgi:membrane fusion protein (multidrug efflux system)